MIRKKLLWIILSIVVLAAASGGYYTSVYRKTAVAKGAVEPAINTVRVGRGDLTVTAQGSGILLPASEVALGFPRGGLLAEMRVKVGDKVQTGQAVARIDDTLARDQVAQAELSLRLAELAQEELIGAANPAALAAAQANLATAKASLQALTAPVSEGRLQAARQNLSGAQQTLQDLLKLPDPAAVAIAQAALSTAEAALRQAQAAYDAVSSRPDVGASPESLRLQEATNNYEAAKARYNQARQGAPAGQIASARAQVARAQADLDALQQGPTADARTAAEAQVAQAQAALDGLLAGGTTTGRARAELNVAQARLNLASARRVLTDTVLLAPAAGTVTVVGAIPGQAAGTQAIVTLADFGQPRLRFWVEEARLVSVAPGNAVTIVFDALPDLTFPGQITSVDPALVTVDGSPAIQSYASIDLSSYPVALLAGMHAAVDIVAGQARNAVLAPLQTLHPLPPGASGGSEQFTVFVAKPDGQTEARLVTVGLRDFVNAEILSGLQPGEELVVAVREDAKVNSDQSSKQDDGGSKDTTAPKK